MQQQQDAFLPHGPSEPETDHRAVSHDPNHFKHNAGLTQPAAHLAHIQTRHDTELQLQYSLFNVLPHQFQDSAAGQRYREPRPTAGTMLLPPFPTENKHTSTSLSSQKCVVTTNQIDGVQLHAVHENTEAASSQLRPNDAQAALLK